MMASLIVKSLILLLEFGDAIVLFGLPVIKLVLGSINDDHAMLDCPCDLRLGSAFQSHIGNEI